jgi:hypothetical protein
MDLDIVFSFILIILIIIIIFNYVSITISDYDERDITKKCGLKQSLFNNNWSEQIVPSVNMNVNTVHKPLTISPLDVYNRQFYLSY